MERVRVSVIVPCRNEAADIDGFIAGILDQELDGIDIEVLVAEGKSTDATRSRLEEWSRRDARVKLVDNPQGTVAPGLNRAIRAASGEVIVRMDVHTAYASDYVAACVQTLKSTGAENVGGPWRAEGQPGWQEAIALAFNSPFAIGGAKGHRADYEGIVDTVYLGCWRRQTLLDIGLFDEELTRNQDDELNLRLTRAGGRIWQSPRIRSTYHPRASLRDLFRQYVQYGYWKVRVIRKHRIPASIRHLVPAGFVLALVMSALAAPFHIAGAFSLAFLSGSYALASLCASVHSCRSSGKRRYLLRMPPIFACFHFGYGLGFMSGLWTFLVRRRTASARFEQLTRP
jgi:succinoglycan biosynthesis protein ExoA